MAIIDGEKNEFIQNFTFESFEIERARFVESRNEIIVARRSQGNFYMAVDLMTNKTRRIPLGPKCTHSMRNFKLSPDQNFIACPDEFGFIRVYEARSSDKILDIKLNGDVGALNFTTDSKRLMAGGSGGHIYFYDFRKNNIPLHSFYDDGALCCKFVTQSPNQQFIATGSSTGLINVYKTEDAITQSSPKVIRQIDNIKSEITDIKFNHTSEVMMAHSSASENALKVFSAPKFEAFANFPKNNTLRRVSAFDFSPKSRFFAVASGRRCPLFRLEHYQNY